ncbi:cation diffusion facilitator family transporter [Mangrovicoccus sp. HB161399]|uniref:cation diffusion facilitator family transporter n=1 Tax=Mangrovicoccus sp. HB161399 TaxID=2720392 RepID=UPI001557CF9E|nr:cation diffusion facilitator family transporter [Mangrovicoccus sp. HB161399]
MPHDHHGDGRGHHTHVDPAAGDARVMLAVGVNIALTVAQVIGGVLSGSLALIADALHNLSDAMALVIAFAARKIARRPADEAMTFGYARAEVVAALVNYTTLIVLGLFLAYEAVMRFFSPEPVAGWAVVIVAGIALAIDLVTAALTYSMSKDSMNIRAAFLHNVVDALGSIAVIVAGSLVILFDWWIVDPLVTLGIAGYMLWMSFAEVGGVIRILMLGSPPQMDAGEVLDTVRGTDGVAGVHHAHLWLMDERGASLDLHVVVQEGAWDRADLIKHDVRRRLKAAHGIGHGTIELESAGHACRDARIWGH